MNSANSIAAVIWDYDGTLVDSRRKNLNVTCKIIERVSGKSAENFPSLHGVDNYTSAHNAAVNWREFYKSNFKLNENEIDEAGRLWTEYQLSDETEQSFFDGIENVIRSIENIPQGIVSQNSKSNIAKALAKNNLLHCFNNIVGYEEVDINKQKPEPDGLLICINKLTGFNPGIVYYIGDHETDTQCAANAGNFMKEHNIDVCIKSIAAFYGLENNVKSWRVKPDNIAEKSSDILKIIFGE